MQILSSLRPPPGLPSARIAVVLAAAGVAVLVGAGASQDAALIGVAVLLMALAMAAIAIRDVEAVLHVLVLSMFAEGVSAGPARIGRILAVAAILTVVGRLLFTTWRPPRLPASAWLPIVGFFAWAWASGFWASSTTAWARSIGQLGLAAAFFAAFALFVRTPTQVRQLLQTYVAGALLAACIGIVQVVVGGDERAVGLQGDGNLYAVYQVAAVPAAVTLARTSRQRLGRWWYVALVPLVGSILASDSRGALLSTAIVLALSFAPMLRSSARGARRAVAVTGVLVAVVGLAAVGAAFNDRLDPERIETDRASGRLDIWYVAWEQSQEHPVLGLGGGNFKEQSVQLLLTEPGVQLVKSQLLLLDEGIEVHNIYLETLVEYGAPGLLLFGAVLVSAAVGIRTGIRKVGRGTALDALLPMLVAYAATAFFLSVVNSKLLWMLVGMAVAFRAVARNDRAPALGRAS